MRFIDLQLSPPLLKAVASEGYTIATPIQEQAIPLVLAGRDVLGCAQTGTGKTAAFALPILHRLSAPRQAPAAAPAEAAPARTTHAAGHPGVGAHPGAGGTGRQAASGTIVHPGAPAHGTGFPMPDTRHFNPKSQHAKAFGQDVRSNPTHPPAAHGKFPRCLVLAPTRELAGQIGQSFRTYGQHVALRGTVIYGGVGQNPQVAALRQGVDIIVATPGRLLDLMNQRYVDLRRIEVLVLDEADRMLDMGFIPDIRRIVAQIPGPRQTLLFSATMPPEIRRLADSLLKNPATVQVAPPASTVDTVVQSVYFVDRQHKPALLAHLVETLPMTQTLVFTRTKHGADRVVKHLHLSGIKAEAIHGNKSQSVRQRALDNFRAYKTPVLVATDIASRGIDVDGITHVVNYDLTHEPETYVHRIGRTARAGATGSAVSFCDHEERGFLKAIERLIRTTIPVATANGFGKGSPRGPMRPPMSAAPPVPPAGPAKMGMSTFTEGSADAPAEVEATMDAPAGAGQAWSSPAGGNGSGNGVPKTQNYRGDRQDGRRGPTRPSGPAPRHPSSGQAPRHPSSGKGAGHSFTSRGAKPQGHGGGSGPSGGGSASGGRFGNQKRRGPKKRY